MEPHTVLIIDDDQEVAESIALFLEGKGHRTRKLYDVTEETYALVAKEPPDLIILDIVLPSCDGIDALRRLQANEATRYIPVIICSVVRRKQRIVEGLDAGAVDFLTKPFEAEELYARVHAALAGRRIDREAAENERLEGLRTLAMTVADEIQFPLAEMRRHVQELRASPQIADSEADRVLGSVSINLDQIEQALQRFQKGPRPS